MSRTPSATAIVLLILLSCASALGDETVTIRVCKPREAKSKLEYQRDLQKQAQSWAEASGQQLTSILLEESLIAMCLGEDTRLRHDSIVQLRLQASTLEASDLRQLSVIRSIHRWSQLFESALLALDATSELDLPHVRPIVDGICFEAAIEFENTGRSSCGHAVFRSMWRLRQLSPSAFETLRPVLNRHYLNSNLRVIFSEHFATEMIRKAETSTSPIARCIVGSWVTGNSTTTVVPEADFQPSSSAARFDFVGRGAVDSRTRGTSGPVSVFTQGKHRFTLRRPVQFDGTNFQLSDAIIEVRPSNHNHSMTTEFDRIPILRSIIRRFAAQKAEENRPEAERVAAQMVRESALPKFQKKTGEGLPDVPKKLSQFADAQSLYLKSESSFAAWSSDTHVYLESRSHRRMALAGSMPLDVPFRNRGVVVQIHESFVNNLIDGLEDIGEEKLNRFLDDLYREQSIKLQLDDLRRRIIDYLSDVDIDEELKHWLPLMAENLQRDLGDHFGSILAVYINSQVEESIKKVGEKKVQVAIDRVIEILKDDRLPYFDFSDCDLIRIRFDDGEMVLVFQSTYESESKRGLIELPLLLKLKDGQLSVELKDRTSIEALPVEIRHRIELLADQGQLAVERALQKLKPTGSLQLSGNPGVRVTDAILCDGWMHLEVDVQSPTEAGAIQQQ